MQNKTLFEFRKLVCREMDSILEEYDSFSGAPIPIYKRVAYLMFIGAFEFLSSVDSLDNIFESEVNYDE